PRTACPITTSIIDRNAGPSAFGADPRPAPTGASPDLRGDGRGQVLVSLGVHLGHVGPTVPEQHLDRLQSVVLPDLRGVAVPELVRVPPVGLPPRLHLGPLVHCQSLPPLRRRLPWPLCQWGRRRERLVARPIDRHAVGD